MLLVCNFLGVLFSPMLTFFKLLDLKVLSLMVWNTVTNQEVFVKSPGGVVVRSHRHKSQSPTTGGGPDEYRR